MAKRYDDAAGFNLVSGDPRSIQQTGTGRNSCIQNYIVEHSARDTKAMLGSAGELGDGSGNQFGAIQVDGGLTNLVRLLEHRMRKQIQMLDLGQCRRANEVPAHLVTRKLALVEKQDPVAASREVAGSRRSGWTGSHDSYIGIHGLLHADADHRTTLPIACVGTNA